MVLAFVLVGLGFDGAVAGVVGLVFTGSEGG